MTIGPMEEEHRDIFHEPATETNLKLHFKGSGARKAFDTVTKNKEISEISFLDQF